MEKDNKSGRDMMVGVYLAVGIALIIATIIGMNEAFVLMSQKSDRNFFLGVGIIVLLIACYTPFVVKVYRRFSGENSNHSTDLIKREGHHD